MNDFDILASWYLDGNGNPCKCSFEEYGLNYNLYESRRRNSQLKTTVGQSEVSTVFLRQDHRFDGPVPVLWETMVFGGVFGDECERYTCREDAEAGHAKWVAKVAESEAAN